MKRITTMFVIAAAALAFAGNATSATPPEPRTWGGVGNPPFHWGIGTPAAIRYIVVETLPASHPGAVTPSPRGWGRQPARRSHG